LNFSLSIASIGLGHLGGGLGPDLDFLLDALAIGDDASAELLLDLLGLVLVAVEDRLLRLRRLHVGDRHGQARLGGVHEHSSFMASRPCATVALGRRSPTGRRSAISPLRIDLLT
jgi:hypothetical protein